MRTTASCDSRTCKRCYACVIFDTLASSKLTMQDAKSKDGSQCACIPCRLRHGFICLRSCVTPHAPNLNFDCERHKTLFAASNSIPASNVRLRDLWYVGLQQDHNAEC
jgi:hypothetical protein